MEAIHARSRDNARTPMHWDGSKNAGFTAGTPWIELNPNYPDINAENVLKDDNSIFHFYKKLIALRKQYDIIVYGKYDLLSPEDEEIFAYTRTQEQEKLLVLCNFRDYEVSYVLPEGWDSHDGKLLISNYIQDGEGISQAPLRPYECRVYHFES